MKKILFIITLILSAVFPRSEAKAVDLLSSGYSIIANHLGTPEKAYNNTGAPDEGMYISQDPIGLAGGNPTLYGYVFDTNTQIDPFGLECNKSKIWQDKNGRWRNPNGTFAKHPGWPDNFGFTQGTDIIGVLGTGHRIDRYGGTNGRFVANAGTPFTQRSLPATDISKEFHTYEVIKPIDGVRTGTAEPWFGQQGGGIQHQLPNSVQYYLDNGNLKEI